MQHHRSQVVEYIQDGESGVLTKLRVGAEFRAPVARREPADASRISSDTGANQDLLQPTGEVRCYTGCWRKAVSRRPKRSAEVRYRPILPRGSLRVTESAAVPIRPVPTPTPAAVPARPPTPPTPDQPPCSPLLYIPPPFSPLLSPFYAAPLSPLQLDYDTNFTDELRALCEEFQIDVYSQGRTWAPVAQL
jgi:hypothetical protein